MNRGILGKAIREVRAATLLFGFGLFAFEWILARLLPVLQEDIVGQIARIPFFRDLLGALLGSELGAGIGPAAFAAIPWVHPVALALLWAHEILITTRLPAAEIDRGTIDLLLAFPVSRWRVWVSESLVWAGTGVLLVGLAIAGGILGGLFLAPAERTEPGLLVPVAVNLFALYLAVGGFGYFVSSLSDRRGRAAGVIFATVLVSFFLNFLTQFWPPAQSVSFLGILHYYRPLSILGSGEWPVAHILILSGLGLGLWAAGGVVFSRRDIRTV